MGEVNELEERVRKLSSSELAEFRAWFIEFDNRIWDDDIAKDDAAGKLDQLVADALADRDAGKARDL